MLKTKLFKTLGSVITAAALLISSQALVFAETENEDTFEYPSLAASWDFSTNTNNGFRTENSYSHTPNTLTVENGEGKMNWYDEIYTDKDYQDFVLEFDYRITPNKPETERRLNVHFGVADGANSNYMYTDFMADGDRTHIIVDGADWGYFSDVDYKFKANTTYSFRYAVKQNSVRVWAKAADETKYTYLGEETRVNIGRGKIKLDSKDWGYIKNLKVYADAVKVSVADGETVSSELANITVTLPHETAVNNSQIKLTQNGNKVGYTFAQSGKTLTITPILKPNKTYVLWLSEDIAGETGGVSITFNTMPAVSASWDFTNNTNNGFKNKSTYDNNEYPLTAVNGEGKLKWDDLVFTEKDYDKSIIEFDYRIEPEKPASESSLWVYFGMADGANGSKNHIRINFLTNERTDIDGIARIIVDGADWGHFSSVDYKFKSKTLYSFRFEVSANSVKIWVKANDETAYTYLGEETRVNIDSGRIGIRSNEYGYIKNLKVYGYDSENYDYVIKNAAYDPQSKKFTADITALSDTAPDAKATVASYSENGLKDVKIVDLPANEKVDLTLDEGSEYKVIVLNNFGDLEPVAECITFN